jgi:hypothetical protein
VARIVAALKAGNDIGPLGQPIHDLAFAFVAPLRADNHHICHSISPLRNPTGVYIAAPPKAKPQKQHWTQDPSRGHVALN